ncbi:hypothetical protein AMECASPLE_033182 [Ameca splendens]|uniref:Uncharacterized protein n=1 Tax=Ameca splendens TaxID=208324 RepID=A0ABV0Y756_9TELE
MLISTFLPLNPPILRLKFILEHKSLIQYQNKRKPPEIDFHISKGSNKESVSIFIKLSSSVLPPLKHLCAQFMKIVSRISHVSASHSPEPSTHLTNTKFPCIAMIMSVCGCLFLFVSTCLTGDTFKVHFMSCSKHVDSLDLGLGETVMDTR